jgi:hypothetical protein
MKKYTFGGQKGGKSLQSPKLVCSCDISIDRKIYIENEKIYFWGSKSQKISLQSPKTEFGTQNQYDRVTYPSIENFT